MLQLQLPTLFLSHLSILLRIVCSDERIDHLRGKETASRTDQPSLLLRPRMERFPQRALPFQPYHELCLCLEHASGQSCYYLKRFRRAIGPSDILVDEGVDLAPKARNLGAGGECGRRRRGAALLQRGELAENYNRVMRLDAGRAPAGEDIMAGERFLARETEHPEELGL